MNGVPLDISLPPSLRQAASAEWRQLAEITAEAFSEDPVNRWIFGEPRAILSSFRVLTRDIYAKTGICHLAGDKGAAMWVDHSKPVDTGFDFWTLFNFTLGQLHHGSKGAVARAMKAGEIMARHHPRDAHFYLFTIGTRRSARGTGLGGALLKPVLAACDRAGMPCYLENSNPVNHGFYAAHGFERTEIFACGEGGPPLEGMWREPASP